MVEDDGWSWVKGAGNNFFVVFNSFQCKSPKVGLNSWGKTKFYKGQVRFCQLTCKAVPLGTYLVLKILLKYSQALSEVSQRH
jgi:hypothetical protein